MINKTIIIAEAGVNHNGDHVLAERMIEIAAEAGADYIKFQTFRTENLVSKVAPLADYQRTNMGAEANQSQFDLLKKLELDLDAHKRLLKQCEERGIGFLSAAFDLDSIDLLDGLGLKILKIPSGEITNYPYLKKIAGLSRQLILSTGMSDLEEIKAALAVLQRFGTPLGNITVLHCNTEYPTPMEDVNLQAMKTLEFELGVPIGYSDHTLGIEVPIAAVALGAKVIEKHFTLDRNMLGPDHKASLEPQELKEMVRAIRNIEKALGHAEKKASSSELKNAQVARKSIHLLYGLKSGQAICEADLVIKRPGTGISPMLMEGIIGRKPRLDLGPDHMLRMEDLI
jgi:N,N'-diacetyllegionaminate synthase